MSLNLWTNARVCLRLNPSQIVRASLLDGFGLGKNYAKNPSQKTETRAIV